MVLFLRISSDSGLHFYKVSWKYFGRYQTFTVDTTYIKKISKGHNSVKNVVGVLILILCPSSDDGLYLYQVSLKYHDQYQSYGADTKS